MKVISLLLAGKEVDLCEEEGIIVLTRERNKMAKEKTVMCESYCYDTKDYKNFDVWKDTYVKYLEGRYKKGKGENIYQDPDCKRNYRLDYYEKLVRFLKQRERKCFDDKLINEKFDYEADNYEGKGVLIRVLKDGKELFCLKSDQFGFSAPDGSATTETQMRIYDVYLKGSKDEYKEEKVAKWIWDSRTIGGSFLWPLEDREMERGNPAYNMARGKYLQDRCDLTLAEIRGCYKENVRKIVNKKYNCLYNKMQNKENENLKKWLGHFVKFETYVKYFCMEDFVETVYDEENNEEFRPINLYRFPKQPNIFDENYKKEDIYDRTENEEEYYKNLCRMLNELCQKIVARSETMIFESNSKEV